MVQELKQSVEAEEIPAAGGHQRDLLCAEEWVSLEDDAEGSPPLEDALPLGQEGRWGRINRELVRRKGRKSQWIPCG